MTSEQFAYWLQGFVELHGEQPSEEQWASIKEHLQTVFIKITPTSPYVSPFIKPETYPSMLDKGWVPPAVTC